jgi:hypothetical protein
MAAGDRKVKIEELVVFRGVPVRASARYQLFVEDKLGVDTHHRGGETRFQLAATLAAFNAMTGAQIRQAAVDAVAADASAPERDSIA